LDEGKMILCIGDSLTLGRLGYSYIPFLETGDKIINKGVNGDTTWGALQRLERYLRDPRYRDADTVIIAVGTNDLLLPYMISLSPLWRWQKGLKAARKRCSIDDNQFRETYATLIELALPRKVILVGLPMIHLHGFPMETLIQRNRIIRELSDSYGLLFVDTLALQQAALNQEPQSYSWGSTGLRLIGDSLLMLLIPSAKDWLAKRRGFELTVDGVHFNSLSARLIAQEIRKAVSKHEV